MSDSTSHESASQKSYGSTSRLHPVAPTSRIAVIGSINMDHIWRVPHFPRHSETISTKEYATIPGGKGAIQAVACMRLSRMGRPASRYDLTSRRSSRAGREVNIVVQLIGAVGGDEAGAEIIEALRGEGLSTERIMQLDDVCTGRANVIVNGDGDNYVILYHGANHDFTKTDILFPTPAPDLVILQLEIRRDTVISLIREAKERGSSVLLNAAPAEQLPGETYRCVDHLIVNQLEADMLVDSGSPRTSEASNSMRAVQRSDVVKKYRAVCNSFLEKGVKNVVITLGDLGGVAANGNVVVDYDADVVDDIVDRTGCGGVFIGAYAVEILRQKASNESFDIRRAVRWASKAAALSIKTLGSIDGIPTAEKLEPA